MKRILRSLTYRAKNLLVLPWRLFPRRYVFLDPRDMQVIDCETLLSGKPSGVWYETNQQNRIFTRGAPTFVDDPDNTELFQPEETIATSIVYPPALTISAHDVHLIGYRSFLTKDGRFFTDDSLMPERRGNWLWHLKHPAVQLNEDTTLKAGAYADTFSFSRPLIGATHIPGRVVMLGNQEPFNYGSFLFRVLPKIVSLEKLGLLNEKILVHMPYPSFTDALVLAGCNPYRLIHHDTRKIYRLDHVIVPGHRNGHALLDPESRAVFAKLREKIGYQRNDRKLYVARHTPGKTAAWNGRVLLNEEAVIERLTTAGFEVVLPGMLSMAEQIRIFAEADLVVGGSGSAMFNTVFCRPGTKVIDIESEPNWINAHMCLFSSLGLDYGIFCGRIDPTDTADVHKRWRVNVDALMDRIASFGRG